MEKLLKTKGSYKKIISEKEVHHKFDYKHSQTLSTNESKIHHENEKSCLPHFDNIDTKSLLSKNLNKYGTSSQLFYLTNFQEMFSRNRSRQKILLNDLCNFKDEQIMEQTYQDHQSAQQLSQLFQYYKYYINNPIIYSKEHFKILYNFYQKKKYLQYKRLKAVLDLDDQRNSMSDDSMNQNISSDAKKTTKENTKTFYIMNLIQTQFCDKHNQSESKAFLELNSHLEEMLQKMNYSHANTPLRNNHADLSDKNSTLFKKKKIIPSQISSYKNTILKKTKKASFYNSNSSLKKVKPIKTSKEPYLSNFTVQSIQFPSMKLKNEVSLKKLRRASNLSMGELESKTNHINISSPKKYHKKRLNSCETVISKNYSKQKPVNEKKIKQKIPTESKFKEQKNEEVQLEEFKSYLKRVAGNYRKSTEKVTQSGLSSHSSKFKKQNSPLKRQSNILIKKLKKKGPGKNSSAKNSQQKSPHKSSKQHLIEQSIFNLKKKIRMAKQTMKCTTSNSSSNLHTHKNKKV